MSAWTDPNLKPPALPVCPEKIPARLKEGWCFVVWRWEWKNDRWDKPPREPNGSLARIDHPESWVSFGAAMEAYASGEFDGIGRVMVKADGLVGVDRDSCVDYASKTIEPAAREIVDLIDSHTELSPSSTGLRTFVFGELPVGGRKKGDVELYDSGRYLTLTGHRVDGQWREEPLPAAVMERTSQIAELHRRVFGVKGNGSATQHDAEGGPVAIRRPDRLRDPPAGTTARKGRQVGTVSCAEIAPTTHAAAVTARAKPTPRSVRWPRSTPTTRP